MFHTLIETAAFDPEATRLLGLAFEQASARAGGDQYQRELIALRIIYAAKNGERDVHRLAEYGLNGRA